MTDRRYRTAIDAGLAAALTETARRRAVPTDQLVCELALPTLPPAIAEVAGREIAHSVRTGSRRALHPRLQRGGRTEPVTVEIDAQVLSALTAAAAKARVPIETLVNRLAAQHLPDMFARVHQRRLGRSVAIARLHPPTT